MALKTVNGSAAKATKGRGAGLNIEGRFDQDRREAFDDGWGTLESEEARALKTIVTPIQAKSIISRNNSPDLPFTQSINPYAGCEHGCIYCYARPTHAYYNLSPGLDFETRIMAKTNAAELLRTELAQLSRRGAQVSPIALGANTDPYQPAEREYKITRAIIEVLAEHNHPFTIVTKNALVERDLDLLTPMAQKNLVRVYISLTNLDHELARTLEPRATAPARRLESIRRLTNTDITVGVLVAPVIPFLTDHQIESILAAAYAAGARQAGYVLLRLPYEIKDLFKDWLQQHYPLKAAHVMSRVQAMREGKDNDANFGSRQRGTGEFAELLRKRFDIAMRKLGYQGERSYRGMDTSLFVVPSRQGEVVAPSRQGEVVAPSREVQLSLF
jgi:DNA repair photolyase